MWPSSSRQGYLHFGYLLPVSTRPSNRANYRNNIAPEKGNVKQISIPGFSVFSERCTGVRASIGLLGGQQRIYLPFLALLDTFGVSLTSWSPLGRAKGRVNRPIQGGLRGPGADGLERFLRAVTSFLCLRLRGKLEYVKLGIDGFWGVLADFFVKESRKSL